MVSNKALRENLKARILELQNKTEQIINKKVEPTFATAQAKTLFNIIRKAWDNYSKAVNVTLGYVKQEVRIAAFLSVTAYEKEAYDHVTAAIVSYNAYQLKISTDILKNAQEYK